MRENYDPIGAGNFDTAAESELPAELAERLDGIERRLAALEEETHASGMAWVAKGGRTWTLEDLIRMIDALDARVSALAGRDSTQR